MKQDIENIIKKNLPMKYELSDENYDLKQIHISYNEAIDDIEISLIADEVLKEIQNKLEGKLKVLIILAEVVYMNDNKRDIEIGDKMLSEIHTIQHDVGLL